MLGSPWEAEGNIKSYNAEEREEANEKSLNATGRKVTVGKVFSNKEILEICRKVCFTIFLILCIYILVLNNKT